MINFSLFVEGKIILMAEGQGPTSSLPPPFLPPLYPSPYTCCRGNNAIADCSTKVSFTGNVGGSIMS